MGGHQACACEMMVPRMTSSSRKARAAPGPALWGREVPYSTTSAYRRLDFSLHTSKASVPDHLPGHSSTQGTSMSAAFLVKGRQIILCAVLMASRSVLALQRNHRHIDEPHCRFLWPVRLRPAATEAGTSTETPTACDAALPAGDINWMIGRCLQGEVFQESPAMS